MREALELAAVGYALYLLAKLDSVRRGAAVLGILFGAAVESCHLGLIVTARAVAEWALAGFLITALLFQREIRRLLR